MKKEPWVNVPRNMLTPFLELTKIAMYSAGRFKSDL